MTIENELGETLEDEDSNDNADEAPNQVEKVLGALRKERELNKQLTRDLKAAQNAARSAPKSLEERLAHLEKRNQELELTAARDAAIREAAANVESGYELDNETLHEWLSTAALSLDNVDEVVARAAARCKKPTIRLPLDENRQPPANGGRPGRIKSLEEIYGE